MSNPVRTFTSIEPLEARIAPAVVINNPLPDLVAGIGKTGATVDLSQLTAPASDSAYHTRVQFITNYDTDPSTAGIQAGVIEIELFDDQAPLTVQNFLAYVNNSNPRGDYDDTLFHRAVQGFVLQGGGYEATSPSTHIPVFPTVHNEPKFPERSNIAGTVAMAKVGGNPNSATSEWFINLADNREGAPALDTQNGGFTVFGKVTDESLALATAITGLLGATPEGQPTQNGVPIKVTDAIVIPPPAASTTGLTYSIDSITLPGTNKASPLLTGKITGSQLALAYRPGVSGLADVTVKISDGTETKFDTFRVDVRPNLIIQHNDASTLVPGDATPLTFNLQNNGATAVNGAVKVKLSMVKVGDPMNQTIELGTQTVLVNLASGASQTVAVKAAVPQNPATSATESYTLKAEIVPVTNERFTDDNVATSGANGTGVHALSNLFGAFNGRSNVVLKYKIGSTLHTWSMKGPGAGQLLPDGSGGLSLTAAGTTLVSSPVVATSAIARIPLTGIAFSDPIGIVSLPSVDVSGPVIASGGVKTLTLGDLAGPSLMMIGAVLPANTTPVTIKLGHVTDYSLESAMPIASLTAKSWVDQSDVSGTVAPDSIKAPSLGVLQVAGEFGADLTLTENVPLKSVVIGGLLNRSTIKTAGNIGTVTVGGIYNSNLLAGLDARPDSVDDFAEARTIQSFTIVGMADHRTELFTNSLLAAQTLGAVKLKGVVKGGAGDFGLVADVIKSYSRMDPIPASSVVRVNVQGPEVFDSLGAFKVQVL